MKPEIPSASRSSPRAREADASTAVRLAVSRSPGGGTPSSPASTCIRSAVLMMAFFALAGCGHRPEVMRPVTVSDPKTHRVDMLVATTRRPSGNPGLRYTGERGEDVRLDNIVVSIPPEKARKRGEVQWPTAVKPDPARSFVTVKADKLQFTEVMPWFHRVSRGRKRVLVFVHGFNNDYADAVYRFAQLMHDARIDAVPILFTWPSRGNMLDYAYDRESTIYSRFGLAEVLKVAAASPDVRDITVVAHSMGSWLTMEALRDIANREGRVSPKIHAVVLASPDIDIDVFRRQVLELGEERPRIAIFSSRNDLALKVSSWIAGDVERLGATDFAPHQDMLARYGISVIDATEAKQADFLGHSAFAQNADILHALGSTFVAKPQIVRAALLPFNVLRALNRESAPAGH